MIIDDLIPPPCDDDIFRNGKPIALIDGRSHAVEMWVRSIAEAAHAAVDWHYSGGVAQVLYLGDDVTKVRIIATMKQLKPTLKGTILRLLEEDEAGLYREGVTHVPEGTVATYYSGGTTSEYIVDQPEKPGK